MCIIQKYKGKKVYLNGDPKGKERIVIDVGICSINGGTYCIKIGEYWYPIYSIVLENTLMELSIIGTRDITSLSLLTNMDRYLIGVRETADMECVIDTK